ncbi:MAG: Gfo/Idh/MocA family oxidoreductase [Pirellulaceae bacterium]|jgi:predicted dehydrogenase|nr:Gfo/Idh/MocA family oxidoreductase [Pirellulaceae bacterium]
MKKLNIGVVGAGWIIDKHLRAIAELDGRGHVVAICDPDRNRAETLAEAFNVPCVLGHYDDLVQMDRVNTVLVAIPTMLHSDVAIKAAQAGKHIVCEKPMAATVADCRRMIDAARQYDVTLTPVHNRLFFPPMVEAKRIIDRGEIGRPHIYRANFTTFYHPARSHVDEGANWRSDSARSGGGIMMEAGVHLIYTAQHLVGRIRSVQVQSWGHDEQSVEECVTVQMTFEPQALGSLVMQWGSGFPDDSIQIIGAEGALLINGIELQTMRMSPLAVYLTEGKTWRMPDVPGSWEQTFTGLWTHLSDVLLDGAPHRLTGNDGCDAIAVIEAAYHAMRSGAAVEVKYLEP